MNVKIYIDNLAPATTENELKALFSAYGNVADVGMVTSRVLRAPGAWFFGRL